MFGQKPVERREVLETPGTLTNTGAIAVPIDGDMSADQVAEVINKVLNQHYTFRPQFNGTDQLLAVDADRLDSSHAFYLGHELAKARTALTLGKNYRQDEALRWGHLTVDEISRHDRLK